MFQKVAGWFQGRHTLFIVACMGIGVLMAWFHKLDGNLVTLLLGLQGMALAHSAKEDYFKDK
jgi:hypothetical protein